MVSVGVMVAGSVVLSGVLALWNGKARVKVVEIIVRAVPRAVNVVV